MSYQAMKRHRGTLNACYEVKEANRKKGYILYGSNYMTFWKRQNYADSKKIRGWGEGRVMNRWTQRTFTAVDILCMILERWVPVIRHLS